jgi:5-methylcytosine-specific restriction endonuclease McrA
MPTARVDQYPFILRTAAEVFLADGLEAGRQVLQPIAGEIWPGLPPRSLPRPASQEPMRAVIGKRSFSPARSAATFRRDHFRCRYCCSEITPRPIAALMHTLYPSELPFHENYKRGHVHPLFWTRVAEADHLNAGTRGGGWDDPDNHVTACVRCNTLKGNLSVEELGWVLSDPIPGWVGLVPLYPLVWERAGRPRAVFHSPWLRAFGFRATSPDSGGLP